MRISIWVGSVIVAALAAPFAIAACSSSSNNASSSGVDAGSLADASTSADGAAVDAGPPYLPAGYSLTPFLSASSTTHTFTKADQVLDPSKSYVVVLETTAGRIVWQLTPEHAPIACNSFIFLTLNHYFDGIAFHRVIDAFVAQGGDPNTISKGQNTWGTGGPGYAFDNEDTDAGLLADGGPDYSTIPNFDDDAGGVVAMANTGQPNSNGSQFFITFGAQSFLDGGYTIFGNVIEGMDVLPKIIRGEPNPSAQQPGYPTRITEAHIGEK
jgi:cyclophilin family peptidyl-prolyl cis-trans isomerase